MLHDNRQHFTCEICGNDFTTISSLRNHFNKTHDTNKMLMRYMTHTKEMLHSCTVCGNSFTLSSNHVFHTRIVHMEEKPNELNTIFVEHNK